MIDTTDEMMTIDDVYVTISAVVDLLTLPNVHSINRSVS